jgi:hypothetical protein
MALARYALLVSASGALAALAVLLSACSGEPFGVLYGRTEAGPDVGQAATDDASVDATPVDDVAVLDAGVDASTTAVPEAAPTVDAEVSVDALSPADCEAGEAAPAKATCAVTFIVTNAFVDGFMLKGVALGGDAPALGAWNPGSAIPLAAVSPGAWSGSVVLEDGQVLQFRFVETGPNEDVWESFTPAGNRTLTVACSSGQTKAPPQYTGTFDVRPPDAT